MKDLDSSPEPRRKSILGRIGYFLFCVTLPVVALTVELSNQMCQDTFFDPIPTPLNVILIAQVALVNLIIWREVAHGGPRRMRLHSFLNGMAIGTSFYYSLLFLPMMLIGIIFVPVGTGLLPLSPAFALIGAVACFFWLKKQSGGGIGKVVLLGIIASFVLLFGAEAPRAFTLRAMQSAVAGDEDSVVFLRNFGSEDYILQCCYDSTRRGTMLLGGLVDRGGPAIHPNESRKLYYRVTGRSFNSVLPPKWIKRGLWDFAIDPEQGGEIVGGRLKNLFLEESFILNSVKKDSALVYTEWTLVFRNDDINVEKEARAQLLLPPGAVVSRATLWVNGKEKEAAFASRSKAREAYENVVRRSQDPLLITTQGNDRVLVQCFPVTPGGGKMRIRLGITSPLQLESPTEGKLQLPKLLERNFTLEYHHDIKVVSDATVKTEFPLENKKAQLTNKELSQPSAHLTVTLPELDTVYCPAKEDGEFVVGRLKSLKNLVPADTIFAVDGSLGLKEHASAIASALPDGAKVTLGGDAVREVSSTELEFVGGQDGARLLQDVVSRSSDKRTIVWLHGIQPQALSSVDELRKLVESNPNCRIIEFPVEHGPNRVVEALDGLPQVVTFPRFSSVESDLKRLLNGKERWQLKLALEYGPEGRAVTDHLARLWAAKESEKLWASGKDEEASALAVDYQLVTPASGAVVLETQEQYDEAGLQPVDSGSVPTIPEPETWALILVAGCILLFSRKRQLA